MKFTRRSGILCHPTSLPSKYGIGDFGKSAYEFIDFLNDAGQKIWQILPLSPTGFGDSPYQSFSAFANNHYLISPDILVNSGLLSKSDLIEHPIFPDEEIDYGNVIKWKLTVFEKAFLSFTTSSDSNQETKFEKYCEDNKYWLEDYALFMSLKEHFNYSSWEFWEKKISNYEYDDVEKWKAKLKNKIKYHKWLQYTFFEQWLNLKSYANNKGISIIGDLPIFVAFDSADLWANPDLFILSVLAGVPPDYFSETGQLWGNPHYNWEKMKEDEYKWWRMRFILLIKLYDIIRIDHFRGFEAAWHIPYGEKTAKNGKWVKAPGRDFFHNIFKHLGCEIPIIAENLGVITEEVEDLRLTFDFPGMKVLQFAFDDFDAKNDFLPHNYEKNSVVYTGTHDNNTTIGWFNSINEDIKKYVLEYINSNGEEINWDFIRLILSSSSDTAIIPLQDILGLDNSARMNFPNTLGGNWKWRYKKEMLTDDILRRLKKLTKLYGR